MVRTGQFTVGHEPAGAAMARHRLNDELVALGVAPEIIDDVALIVSELVTNAVRHTSAGGSHLVDWQLAEHEIMVSVDDDSVVRPVVRDPDTGTPGGLGLPIVGALSTAWGVSSIDGAGKRVWARVNVP